MYNSVHLNVNRKNIGNGRNDSVHFLQLSTIGNGRNDSVHFLQLSTIGNGRNDSVHLNVNRKNLEEKKL